MSSWAASTLTGAGALLALLWCDVTSAHHSAAVFDASTLIELRGEIVSFKLRSPHASFVIDAQEFIDDQPVGDVERWEIESESVPVLRSQGIDADTFEAGDTVTMKVARHRDRDFKFAHSHAIYDAFGSAYVMTNSDRLYSPSLRVAAELEDNKISDTQLPAAGSPRLVGRWQQPLTRFDGDGPGLPLNDAGMAAGAPTIASDRRRTFASRSTFPTSSSRHSSSLKYGSMAIEQCCTTSTTMSCARCH
jgi:hypothetical protein